MKKMDVVVKNIPITDLQLFDKVAQQKKMNRSEFFRTMVKIVGHQPLVLETETRYERLTLDVLRHLELNTIALTTAIEMNLLPDFASHLSEEKIEELENGVELF